MNSKVLRKIMSVTFTLALLVVLVGSVVAQGNGRPVPRKHKVLKAARSTIVHVGNGRYLRFPNQDITDFMNGRGIDPMVGVRQSVDKYFTQRDTTTVVQDPLGGDSEVWLRADTNVLGHGVTYLVQNTTHQKKLEAWSTKININGWVNSEGLLAIKYTSGAYAKVTSPNMIGWSGCALINTGGTTRYATMDTTHKQYKTQTGTEIMQKAFNNSVTLRWSCTID